MVDFTYRTEAIINASPQAIFDIVSNPARHVELAGSRELKKVTQQPPGPVGTGTHIFAEETTRLADGSTMDLTADSIVVTYDPPKSLSWIVNPALPEQIRRIQWWFRMAPQGSGTRVIHEVEVDFGDLQNDMLKGFKDNYEQIRASVVRAGMEKTLENLKKMTER
jgi:hypothetical protein